MGMDIDITKSGQADDAERLSGLAAQVLELAAARGASQAEVSINEDSGLAVNVRMGEVETVERTRDRGVSLTVYFGQRKASASTADLQQASLLSTVEQACAIARFTEADSAAGLADAGRMASEQRDFDQWHPWDLDAPAAIALAIAAESRGRDSDKRISNSDGAAVNSSSSLSCYANSHGFSGFERSTSHSISCSLIAGKGDGMQRDYWYTAGLSALDLESPAEVGRHAAERTVARLDPRPIKTGEFPVLFSAESARSLVGHLLGAVSGGALYRRASFLLDAEGTQLFPDWFSILEDPFLMRGFRSSSFDAEGVATIRQPLVSEGVLQHYLLGSYSARKLGLSSTGNAGGAHNLRVAANAGDAFEIARRVSSGLFVTDLMGQGVNTITGDYSRGAAGFWIENGEITHAVDEITIAGNLRQMFMAIEAVGSDVDRRSHVECGSILVGRMMVAGAS
jgi:PmbA protein